MHGQKNIKSKVKYKNKHSVKHKDKERDRRKKKQSIIREEMKNNKINGLRQSHASGSIHFPTRGLSQGKTVQLIAKSVPVSLHEV